MLALVSVLQFAENLSDRPGCVGGAVPDPPQGGLRRPRSPRGSGTATINARAAKPRPECDRGCSHPPDSRPGHQMPRKTSTPAWPPAVSPRTNTSSTADMSPRRSFTAQTHAVAPGSPRTTSASTGTTTLRGDGRCRAPHAMGTQADDHVVQTARDPPCRLDQLTQPAALTGRPQVVRVHERSLIVVYGGPSTPPTIIYSPARSLPILQG